MPYRHTQAGWLPIVVSLVPMLAAAYFISVFGPNAWLVIGLAATMLVVLLFGWMTIEIDGSRIRVRYGVGLLRKSIPLEIVRAAHVVRNKWWYGWGIRLTPHGWMFNVSGLDAVEIELASGRRVRIGSDEPERLARAVRASLRAPR